MLRLYDTRARAVLPVEPWHEGQLRLYACGPTVYRDAHVGNLRSFLLPDLIRRIAEYQGLTVTIAQNITDVGHMLDDTGLGNGESSLPATARIADTVGDADEGQLGDDRMLRSSGESGVPALAIARHYEERFRHDCELLGITPHEFSPRASDCIDQMVDAVSRLLEMGHAYRGDDGSVFFDARSFPGYGDISGNRLDALRPGHRFSGTSDPNKKFHADWALWKSAPATRTQLVWDTPVGRGFPGWHIECTAMLLAFLGEYVDVHTGGIDLRFPHHEDERAQTESLVGHQVVRHWVHAEHLLFEGRKMSKSAGNVVLLADVISRGYDPRSLRLAFLEQHYRRQVDLSWDAIAAADRVLRRWRQLIARNAGPLDAQQTLPDATVMSAVVAAWQDDLDTAASLRVLREYERSNASEITKAATLRACDALLGLNLNDAAQPATSPEVSADVTELLNRRQLARETRDWSAADALREQILALGWEVVDSAEGQRLSAVQR